MQLLKTNFKSGISSVNYEHMIKSASPICMVCLQAVFVTSVLTACLHNLSLSSYIYISFSIYPTHNPPCCTYMDLNFPCFSPLAFSTLPPTFLFHLPLCCVAQICAPRQARALGSPSRDVPAHTAQPGHPRANGPFLHARLEPRDHRHLRSN